MYERILNLEKALQTKSHFLLGPRATGKSWLIKHQLKNVQLFDLLNSDTFNRFLRQPRSLSNEILPATKIVVIDEIQKLPNLLDEVHGLIEEKGIHFLLTGSSARKLKHSGANLLAGRARGLQMFPLIRKEINDFDLLKYCNTGGLPIIWKSDDYWLDLRSYVQFYLKEEIIAEAVVRKIDHYANFIDVIGQRSGEQLNLQSIASDSGVPVRTIANFIEILKDTLLAFELEPYRTSKGRKVVTKSKIYLFDVGVANYLAGRKNILERSDAFGVAFEHFIIQEIRAYLGYKNSDSGIRYWRTVGDQFEVDCIIGNEAAIEIKDYENFNEKSLTGLKELKSEKSIKNFYLVSRDPVEREVDGIKILSYDKFLDALWAGKIAN
jgi:predicted AAA+ superfamily ATPase